MSARTAAAFTILVGALSGFTVLLAQTALSAQQRDPARMEAGKRLFADTCQNEHCHGGSALSMEEHSGLTAEHVRKVINEGLPDVGMQAFNRVYEPDEIEQLVAYILSVTSRHGAPPASSPPPPAASHPPTSTDGLRGDPAAGRSLFFAATQAKNCADCHEFLGTGGVMGPDLSEVGGKPSRELFRRIVMRDGHATSRMPTDDYASIYSVKQLLDLVAFLKSTDRASGRVTLTDVF